MKGISMSTVQTNDQLLSALAALQSAETVVNQDDAQISQTELALQGNQTTLSQQQSQRTTDFTTAQSAADGVVAALAGKGYAINVPQPTPDPNA
jgi:hypothetical protein